MFFFNRYTFFSCKLSLRVLIDSSTHFLNVEASEESWVSGLLLRILRITSGELSSSCGNFTVAGDGAGGVVIRVSRPAKLNRRLASLRGNKM